MERSRGARAGRRFARLSRCLATTDRPPRNWFLLPRRGKRRIMFFPTCHHHEEEENPGCEIRQGESLEKRPPERHFRSPPAAHLRNPRPPPGETHLHRPPSP